MRYLERKNASGARTDCRFLALHCGIGSWRAASYCAVPKDVAATSIWERLRATDSREVEHAREELLPNVARARSTAFR